MHKITSEALKTELEKLMLDLPSNNTEKERRNYLAGVIDTWNDVGLIDGEIREELYAEYGP